MKPIMPPVKISGDTEDRIIARSGKLIAFSKSRFVWRFGFLLDSPSAQAFGVRTNVFIWLIADKHGRPLDIYKGWAVDLPDRFKRIIKSSL